MIPLCCPMCHRAVLRVAPAGGGGTVIEARCRNRHCSARPLITWRVTEDRKIALLRLDSARARAVA